MKTIAVLSILILASFVYEVRADFANFIASYHQRIERIQ